MNNKKGKDGDRRGGSVENVTNGARPISYRLKCPKTANGLSHFVMYGDAHKKRSPM